MALPGSIEARYEVVAGPAEQRAEYYVARRRLHFTIREWRALSWWERRVYVEGMNNEARDADTGEDTPDQASPTGARGVDAILYGSSADVAASGYGT